MTRSVKFALSKYPFNGIVIKMCNCKKVKGVLNMVENFRILFNKDEPVREFDLTNNLGLLIGKNGIGKTTIMNILFHTLNADLITLKKFPFLSIIINFKSIPNIKKIDKIVKSIEVKNTEDVLGITYNFTNKKRKPVKIDAISTFFADAVFTIKNNDVTKKNANTYHYEDLFNKPTSMEELITKNERQLSFINEIKKSILYFPTYRRLDQDLYDLSVSNSFSFNNDENIRNFMNEYPIDKRVLGVDEKDIHSLFESYSENLRVFSSTALNKVLVSFIEETIKSATYNSAMYNPLNNKSKKSNDVKLINSASKTLINLSKQLNLEIDEQEIIHYYNRQKEVKEILSKNKSATVKFNISVNDLDNSSDKKMVEDILRDRLFNKSYEEAIVMILIDLYGQYAVDQENKLKKFNLLQSILNKFFGEKIQLSINKKDYSISISQKFTNLSSGEKQLLTFFTFIILGTADSTYYPFVLIDEPEISLHVEWQYKLIEQFLRIPDITYFMATHSPYVGNSDYKKHLIKGGIGGLNHE